MKVVLHATLGKAAIVERLRAILQGELVIADDPATAIAALPGVVGIASRRRPGAG